MEIQESKEKIQALYDELKKEVDGNNTHANDFLYHYTELQYLKQIVNPDNICMKATYYKKYNQNDYKWIKTYAEPIVEKICKQLKLEYDPDCLSYSPYIISFSTEPDSKNMWDSFASKGKGLVLKFKREALLQNAHYSNAELMIPCSYVKAKDASKIEEDILKIYKSRDLGMYPEQDKIAFAAIGILPKRYCKQNEVRYVKLCQWVSTVRIVDGEIRVEPHDVQKADWDKERIIFPKDALAGITFGKRVSREKYNEGVEYLIGCGIPKEIISKKGDDATPTT